MPLEINVYFKYKVFLHCNALVLPVQDCNLVLYSGSGTPIYYSATYGQGSPPCKLTVADSRNGGGFIKVSDSPGAALYMQPPSFDVLLDAGQATAQPFAQDYQRYQARPPMLLSSFPTLIKSLILLKQPKIKPYTLTCKPYIQFRKKDS